MDGISIAIIAAQALFGIIILYFIVREGMQIKRHGFSIYIGDPWNSIEVYSVLLYYDHKMFKHQQWQVAM